jgi:hypothetical protein
MDNKNKIIEFIKELDPSATIAPNISVIELARKLRDLLSSKDIFVSAVYNPQYEEFNKNRIYYEEGSRSTENLIDIFEKNVKLSKKENDDYIKSVTKKLKDYLKDGSKDDFSLDPKHFPKGNGQLEKMKKKAYKASGAVEDYVDNFTAAGLENLNYDEIDPNEDWVSDNVKGSSRTGNNPKWGNAVETDVNTKRDEIRKKNLLGKIKKKAYNKAAQPISKDTAGENEGDKIMAKLESIEPKKEQKLNEEFDKMKKLISYSQKTQ